MKAASDTFEAASGQLSRKRLFRRAGAILGSARFQLIGALITGVFGSYAIREAYEYVQDPFLSYSNTNIGTVAAVLLGLLFYRKVTSLPGTAALMNTVPAFTTSYVAVAAIFFAFRLDFSRQQFVISYLAVIAFFFIIGFIAARLRRPAFGYVPGGRADELTDLHYADWIRLSSPAEARRHRDLPLVADLHNIALSDEWERFIAEAAIAGRHVYNARQLKESLEGQVEIEHISENSFGHLAPDSIYAPLKFYIDVFTALAALIVLSPLLLLVAIAIRLDSKGPALFRQQRMGFRGRPFMIYKFRSMREPGSAIIHPQADMTLTDDQRITAVGRFIRKTRVDELPQILNILLGQMSWIGPRPETIRLAAMYEAELPFYAYRHIVRPGITGWAQVKQGHVTSVEDVRHKLQFDFYYVKNFSIWLDALICIHTVRVILTGHGAK
jgi:lipopolysaccharide/colanic/teichoic acid biosynthesis glycosyltransferase